MFSNLNIQSIFFNKNNYTLKTATEYLINNSLSNFKRINEDKYYYRFTYQSRLKLQNNNYVKQIKYLEDNTIKIEHYIKLNINVNLLVKF
jgi:hypothetical protein